MKEAGEASRRLVGAVLTSLLLLGSAMAQQAPPEPVLAPGWTELEFEPPEPGSYSLPPMGLAGDGRVLDSNGDDTSLHALMGDKVVVLSFIYSSCSDANGCPLATHVLERLQDRLLEDPAAGQDVRFISLSFDPVQDTPEVMRRYGKPYISGDFDWRFLTTAGQADLQPILDSYGQTVVRDPNSEDGEAGSISHILRVYLVDRGLRIRNIFSASFLHADTMLNDIRTLQMEPADAHLLQGPGDDKSGYDDPGYVTRAQSLEYRKGRELRLWSPNSPPPLGLPPLPVPADNALSETKIRLGRLLFFDRRLSHNKTFSCAMCHIPEQGFTSNELATAVGIEGRTVRRNSPTIYNVAYLERLFHDGRESSLEQQIWGPLLARNEMGNPSPGMVIEQVSAIPAYVEQFSKAFPGRGVTMETLGQALASYQRVLVSANSPFDRWRYGGDDAALGEEARAGFDLFTGKAGCSGCHRVGEEYALFTDQQFHNTGIGFERAMARPGETMRVQVAPGEHLEVQSDIVVEASEPKPNDLGLYEITNDPDDRWKYRTPSLRNIALTAPYMHDGSLSGLSDVVDFYNQGGVENELRDPRIRPLGLSEEESSQLVAFLESLTGDNVDRVVADAFTVPVGNTGSDG